MALASATLRLCETCFAKCHGAENLQVRPRPVQCDCIFFFLVASKLGAADNRRIEGMHFVVTSSYIYNSVRTAAMSALDGV